MGAGLAKAAYLAAAKAGVDHAPTRVLVYMALVALDSDPEPSYFGGRTALAESLGAPATTSGFRAVDRAMSTLSRRGLTALARKGAPGRHSRYLLRDETGSPLSADTPRSASGDRRTHHGERVVNNSEHTTVSGRTHHGERSEHTTVSVDLRSREDKEEETRASAPTRTCRRHSSWEHDQPCRACAADRRAAEALANVRTPSTMSPRVLDCGSGNHRLLPDKTCMVCEYRDPLWDVA
ncbi:hypothetical protein RS85_01395 [Microbacterium sp. SA39]|nr:hypothetical protein RS85_01395 [Microbacterium sp. SA39]